MSYQPTDEQQQIIDKSRDGESIKVMAFAGTGKTSTLIDVANASPRRKMLYLAFNKSTQLEAQAKFPKNVECRTAHSLAYRAFGADMRDRLGKRLWARELAADKNYPALADHDPNVVAAAVLDSMRRFERSGDREVMRHHVPRIYLAAISDVDPGARTYFQDDIVRHARNLWNETVAPGSRMPARHDTYLKLWQLSNPRLRHDTIMFDEAQDASPVMSAIVEGQQQAQRIYVGDTHQQIYAWRGAVDALEALDCPEYALTQSFRFGPEVADVANDILSLKGRDFELKGFDRLNTMVRRVGPADSPKTVLCRTNAEIIGRVVSLVSANQRVHVIGGVDDLVRQIHAVYDLWRDAPHRRSHPLVSPFKRWDDFVAASETEDGAELLPLTRIARNYKEEMPQVADLLARSSGSEHGVDAVLSTVHKAKGREWTNVVLANDFVDLVNDKGEVAPKAEINLSYVAVTRAQGALDIEECDGIDAMYGNRALMADQAADKTAPDAASSEAPEKHKAPAL